MGARRLAGHAFGLTSSAARIYPAADEAVNDSVQIDWDGLSWMGLLGVLEK
jgi:hypothetical protein